MQALSPPYLPSLLIFLLLLGPSKSLISLVSGANGYIAREIVARLLASSSPQDEIICLVRPHRVASERSYWERYCNPKGKFSVLPYDMLDGGETLRDALEHCGKPGEERCLFHLASVFGPTENHTQTALDNVKGTEDLIQVLSEQDSPVKLVLTSSMAAVRGTGQLPGNGKFYTHEDWNTESKLGTNWGASYQWSKMRSEQRARELCERHSIPLVVLNPSFVFGPPSLASSSGSYSISLVGQWARGESPVQSRLFVDVRDVAKAHIAAARQPGAVGQRYIVSCEARVASEVIAEWLKDVCRSNGLGDPDKIHFDGDFDGGAIPIGEKEVEAENRLRDELGVSLRPVKDTIVDMGAVLLQDSMIS